jgi:hypothetical protein
MEEDSGVQRELKTGSGTGGGGSHYRKVNLCDACSVGLFSADRSARLAKVLAVLALVALLVGGWVYVSFLR